MYAIVEYKGNQYKAEKDAVLEVAKISDAKKGDTVTVDTVLLVSDGDKVSVGTPYVKGAKVVCEVVKHGKQKKILVFKYRPKKKYRLTKGHRQPYTKLVVKSIVG